MTRKREPRALILQGLPASGKTTYARELQDKEPGRWKRFNRDELRAMLDGPHHQKGSEQFLISARNAMLDVYLDAGYDIIIDDTNLNPAIVKNLYEHIDDRAEIEIKMFDVSVEECINRDAQREKAVGEQVIREMAEKYLRT